MYSITYYPSINCCIHSTVLSLLLKYGADHSPPTTSITAQFLLVVQAQFQLKKFMNNLSHVEITWTG